MVVMMMIHANCCLIFAAISLLDVIKVLVMESLEGRKKRGKCLCFVCLWSDGNASVSVKRGPFCTILCA